MIKIKISVLMLMLLVEILSAVLAQTNYCSANLCKKGKKHIACNNNGKFSSACNNPRIIKLTQKFRRQIVNKHNALRNNIAKGFRKFPSAERMASMQWNHELARIAEYNVKQCKMQHDQCRNTKRFANSGQNIAQTTWRGKNMSVSNIINTHIQNWFNEYRNCPISTIKSYKPQTNGKAIGHFTSMIQEKSNRIGCAIIRHNKNGSMQQIMTCNYASTNIKDKPVYRQGKAASKCKTGRNKKYTYLCTVKEKYKLN